MLFLYQRSDGLYEPNSPQGVVILGRSGYARKLDEPLDGKLVLKEFTISNSQINKPSELENYILEQSNVKTPTTLSTTQSFKKVVISNFILYIFLVLFLALLAAIGAFSKRQPSKK